MWLISFQGRRYEIFQDNQIYTSRVPVLSSTFLENDKDIKFEIGDVEALSTSKLFSKANDPVVRSELGWRLFGPFTIIIALMLSVALSECKPDKVAVVIIVLFHLSLFFASLIVLMIYN